MKKKSGITMRRSFDCGFCIYMTDQNTIEDNARDDGIELTDEVWERLSNDMIQIEQNVMDGLERKYNIAFRSEGHDNNSDLIGTCWLKTDNVHGDERIELTKKQAEAYKLMMGIQGEDVALDMLCSYNDDLPKVFFKCSKITRQLVDVYMYFFAVDGKDRDIYDAEIEAIEQDGRE